MHAGEVSKEKTIRKTSNDHLKNHLNLGLRSETDTWSSPRDVENWHTTLINNNNNYDDDFFLI